MRITAFENAMEFQRCAQPVLGGREAELNFMIALLAHLAKPGEHGGDASPLMLLIEGTQRPVGIVVRTPPHNLLLTDVPCEAMPALATWLRERQIDLPGVMGPKAASEAFAAEWSRRSARTAQLHVAMRTHQLQKVTPTPAPPGQMRQATQEDFELLVSWAAGFSRDTRTGARDEASAVRRCLESGGLWLWADPQPVAMANCGQPTPNGIRLNWVYTPPEHRCHGYATVLVAQLSQHLLDSGRKFCFLFTDLANPTSNSIYRKIGYEGVCDYAEYHFV